MTKQEIIDSVGQAVYEAACALREEPDRFVWDHGDLPHEITDLIWEAEGSWSDRIDLFFAIYDDIPSFDHLGYAMHHYLEFGPRDRAHWWTCVRQRLVSSDAFVREPLLGSLKLDYFETSAIVGEAWHACTDSSVADVGLLQAVLPVSGPVPYSLKRKLYRRLLRDRQLHQAIFLSLLGSAFDSYGSIEPRHALRVLSKLSVDHDEQFEILRGKLNDMSV